MTRLEKMKELLSLPVEELAEKIVTEYGVADELGMMWRHDDCDPGADYCLQNHKTCRYLDTYYDPECPGYYGCCSADEGECPYGVDRKEVFKNKIIEDLNEEVRSC